MQIRVKCNCGDGKCSEWAIVELQGVVESQLAISDQINGLEIGHLCCSSSSSSSQPSYILTVGYHELSGTKVQLKKPLLVLQKKAAADAAGPEFPASSAVELEVIGIIRQKILFKTRPKALISRTLALACLFPSYSF
ncbi:Ctf8 [Musa troglodytarum]|uniref:Ctf8 n=1 Tax=Musa troglodytarum TaxID=320322 RepID=A0A9E7GLR5_9LILI|nr:Ctf8 [Musa troglodytarum]